MACTVATVVRAVPASWRRSSSRRASWGVPWTTLTETALGLAHAFPETVDKGLIALGRPRHHEHASALTVGANDGFA